MRRVVAAAGVYIAAAAVLTWPLVAAPGARLGATEGPGDPYLNLWTLGWGVRAWLDDPWGTLSGRAFGAPIFHPAPLSLTFTEHQLLQGLAAAPVVALGGGLSLAYNLVLLGSIAFSGIAMHGLARAVTGSTTAAFTAGLAWACWPYRTAALNDLPLQALYFLPLAVWALVRVAARRRWRDAVTLGAAAGLQAVASAGIGALAVAALAIAAPVLGWVTGQWRATRYWTRVAIAALVALLAAAPVVIPYVQGRSQGQVGTAVSGPSPAGAWQHYLQVPRSNLLYGRTGLLSSGRSGSSREFAMFPGAMLLVLAGCGAWAGWRSDARAPAVTALALATVGVWLSTGPALLLDAHRFAAPVVPGLDAIDAPQRYGVVAMLGVSLLAGLGMARVVCPRPHGRRVALFCLGVMLFEYGNAPLALVEAPLTETAVGRWLREAPEEGSVLYLPIDDDGENTVHMVESLEHGRPVVNGSGRVRPASYAATVGALSTLPDAPGLARLAELNVRFVVAPVSDGLGRSGSPLVERARYGRQSIYEVRRTAEAADSVPGHDAPPLPGHVAFAAGERATYVVRWIGGVPAGEVTLHAVRPDREARATWPGAAWRLEARAGTAPWMSGVFEARDTFVTLATPDLLPIVQTRDIDEGSRQRQIAYVYDAGRGQVRAGVTEAEARDPGQPATPLAPQARDALAALYFLRTLPLEAGAELTIPVNDAGRPLTARLVVEGLEDVPGAATASRARRLSIGLERGPEADAVTRATLWVSDDARRVPVRLEIAAGFGRVRVELVDYRP